MVSLFLNSGVLPRRLIYRGLQYKYCKKLKQVLEMLILMLSVKLRSRIELYKNVPKCQTPIFTAKPL